MDNNASIESLSIEIDSTIKDSSASINDLIKLLNALKTNLQDTINTSRNFKELKTNLSTSSIKASNIKAPSKTKVSSSTGYGNINKQLMDEKLGLNIGSEEELKRVATLKSRIVDVNGSIEKYITQNNKLVTVSKQTKDGIEQVKVSVKDLANQTEKSSGAFSKFGSVLGKGVKSFLAIAGINKSWNSLKNYAEEASAYTESLNLFMVTMGNNAEKGLKWINKYTDALHLDPSDVMQYMGAFNSLTKGLGVGSDKAYLMSQNLTQLTYDLASFKNLSFDTSFRKLQSAISGELEPLRNVGVALSQNTLQTLAYSLGIEKNVADMTEAQKAQLRYIQIMKSSSEWQTDMARTLMSPANAIRIIKQQFTLLARAIGNVLIPILMMAIPYVMVITEWLTKLANKLANLLNKIFGIKLDFNFERTAIDIGNIATGVGDIGTAAKKTGKELNTMLAPFDDLNVVQNELNKNGSGLGDDLGAGDLGVDLPTYDALEGLTDKLRANMDKARENLKNFLPVLATVGTIIGGWKLAKWLAPLFEFGSNGAIGKGVVFTNDYLKKIAGNVLVKGSKVIMVAVTYKLAKNLIDVGNEPVAGVDDDIFDTDGISDWLEENVKNKLGNVLHDWGWTEHTFGISDETKERIRGITDELFKTSKALDNLYLKHDIISQNDVDTFKERVNELNKSILDKLDEKRNEELKNLRPLKAYTDPETYQKMVDHINEFYNKQKEAVTSNEGEINQILTNAANENRTLTQDEYDRIYEIIESTSKNGVKTLSKNTDEFNEIWTKVNGNLEGTTAETASSIMQSAAKARDTVIKNAKDQYDTVKKEADKMKQAGSITEEEYNNMINSAKRAKELTIINANGQYSEILKTVEQKVPGITKKIDLETGKIKTNWQSIWDSLWGDTKDSIKKIESEVGSSGRGHSSGAGGHTLTGVLGYIPTIADSMLTDFTRNINGLDDSTKKALGDVNHEINNWQPADIKVPHFDIQLKPIGGKGVLGGIVIPEITPRWYAEGGFPTSGDLFFANENGAAEMVGRIGNRTAVANNDQITTSITNAVVQGIVSSGLNNKTQGKTTIYIGNKKVYEGYGDYIESENDRYGTNMIRI